MRRYLLSLLLTTAYAGAATAQSCVQPAESQAFNVIALKSALMVSALSCNDGEQYDAFMTEFQPHILAEQHVMDAFFRRAGGLAGQTQEDEYVTSLANAQSAAAIAQGAPFCNASAALFTKVAALQADGDLDTFASATPLAQPISLTSCGGIGDHLHHDHPTPTPTLALADTGFEADADPHLHHRAADVTLADNQ